MISLDLSKHARARVWIGELPDAVYLSTRPPISVAEAIDVQNASAKLAAVEVLIPTGPRFLYGLLGGQWSVSIIEKFVADVGTTDTPGRLFKDNLAGILDEVRVGLPSEHASAIFKGIEMVKNETGALPGGRLSINCAAYGAVGSCEPVFKHLAAILIKLLTTNIEPSEKTLLELFPTGRWLIR